MNVRRVVTGHSEDWKAAVVSDTEVAPDTVGLLPGLAWYKLWGADRPPRFPDNGSQPFAPAFFPPLGGYRFLLFTVPPGAAQRPPVVDRKALFTEMEQTVPGLALHMERNTPGMHTSDSIDFGYVVSGEVWLELDDGKQVHLRAGDTYVQNGTRHAWRNKASESCRILVVLIGVPRQPSRLDVAREST